MGYRAHVVTQEREYGSSIFSDFTQFEKYFDKIRDTYPEEEIFQSEGQDFFEIYKGVIEEEVKRLTELGLEEEFEFQPSWDNGYKETNGEVAASLERALKESPKDSIYVSLEWY